MNVSSAAEINVSRSNGQGVLPSSKESRMPLKSISLQTKTTAGSWHQNISAVTSASSVKSC